MDLSDLQSYFLYFDIKPNFYLFLSPYFFIAGTFPSQNQKNICKATRKIFRFLSFLVLNVPWWKSS